MFNLILKDMMVQKKNFLISLIYPIFAVIAFNNTFPTGTMYVFAILSTAYILISGAAAHDEKNNSDILLNSFPIRRSEIVIAKYLSIFVFLLYSVLITFIESSLIRELGILPKLGHLKLEYILQAVISICTLYLIFYPIYYKLGYMKMKMINILLYMVIFFVPVFVTQYMQENRKVEFVENILKFINGIPAVTMKVFGGIVFVIFMFISLLLSVKIYEKKDF